MILECQEDKIAFIDALLKKQFYNEEPNLEEMNLIVRLSYVGQKHNIDASVKGYIDKTGNNLFNPLKDPCQGGTQPPSKDPSVQEKEKEKEKVKEKEYNTQNQDFAEEIPFEELEHKKNNQKINPKINHEEIVKIFNDVCKDLPKVIVLSDKRKKMISDRAKQFDLETIGKVFTKVSESDFLNGKTGKFTASFDWIFKHENFVKILEDNYKNKKSIQVNQKNEISASDALRNRLQELNIPIIQNYQS
jgi:hypothetical protein